MIQSMQSILYDISWKAVLKDIAKFYIYLVVLYGLAFLLVWGQAYISLENYNANIDRVLSEPFTANTGIKDFSFETHETIAKQMSQYMFILVCFGVFFAIPPKKFKHVAIVTILISLTANFPFLYEMPSEWLLDNFYLLGGISIAWLCSIGWNKFKISKIKNISHKT